MPLQRSHCQRSGTVGSGRMCIHWLIRDAAGPIATELDVRNTERGPLPLGGFKGRMACRPEQNTVYPQHRGQETFLCLHSDDPRAATCPDCLATEEYKKAMAELGETVAVAV